MAFSSFLLSPSSLLLIGTLLCTTRGVYGGYLFGLPMRSPKANLHIEAILTDKSDNQQWMLSEDIAGTSDVRGKIHVIHGGQHYDIFYREGFDDERLIINGSECKQMDNNFNFWYKLTPGADFEVKRLLILAGPSIIYRLSDASLKWESAGEIQINGTEMKQITTFLFDGKLAITASFKSASISGLNEATRLIFKFSDSNFLTEELVLKIIKQAFVDENLDGKVAPTPGIGCPNYFYLDQEFPELKTRQLHLTAIETVTNPSGIRNINLKVYADALLDRQVTRIEVDDEYTINDFNLAVSYVFKNGKCSITSFSEKMEGIIGGHLSINELIWMNGQYKYIGKTIYEPIAQGLFDTWESTEYGRIIDGIRYDKVVTTQYLKNLSHTSGTKETIDYIPIAFTRFGFNKDTMGKYQVVESRRRDILEFQRIIPQSQYQSLFQITDCFESKERQVLSFDIRNEDYGYQCNPGVHFAEENIYEFKESFKLLLTKNLSPLRINSMIFDFQTDRISSTVEFLEKPALEKSFHKRSIQLKVGSKMVTHYGAILVKSVDECLKARIANRFFRQILYCPSFDSFCVDLEDPDHLSDTGDKLVECSIYTYPLANIWRLVKEAQLSDLHKVLLRTENMTFTTPCDNCTVPGKSYRYRVINVLENTYFDDSSQEPKYMKVQKFSKLDAKHLPVQDVTNQVRHFGDCYKSCSSSKEHNCATFTYCTNEITNECYTSSTLFTPNATVSHQNCTTYARNFLLEYQKVANNQFKDAVQVSFGSWSVDDCAAKCHRSGSCSTFQYCDGQCTFTGPYLPKTVKSNANCDIYIPKKAHEFTLTGSNLVSRIILNVDELNLEQCAALCYSWKDGNESCKSFNYCPKGLKKSSCGLSKYSVSDSTVETYPTSFCLNFELFKAQPKVHKSPIFLANDDMGNAGASISLAFLVVGLALGIAVTSIYHTINNRHKYTVTTADQESND